MSLLNQKISKDNANLSDKEAHFELIKLISQNPLRSSHLDCLEIINLALDHYPDNQAEIQLLLSDYLIRLGEFQKARDHFNQAIDKCESVKDFGVLFQAFLKFEEGVAQTEEDLDRIEQLVDRREFLLSNVVLRQNPNNVYEWLNRVKLS